LECANMRVLGSAFLSRVQGHLYVHCSKNFLDIYITAHKEQRKDLTKK